MRPARPPDTAGRRPRRRGFTLIEVMVALAIVAVALGAGLRAAGALTDNAQRLGDVISAQWCADNQLANLKLARQFPDLGEADFTCNQLGRDYKGQVVVRGTPNPNFRRVDAVVGTDTGVPLLTLSTVLPKY